ncbi:hypothetical protein D9M72_565250 [compost metagenome]
MLCALFDKTGIFQKDDPVASCKFPNAALRAKRTSVCQSAFAVHDRAQGFVEALYIFIGMGEHQHLVAAKSTVRPCCLRSRDCLLARVAPVSDETLDCFGTVFNRHYVPLLSIGIEPLFDLAACEEPGGITRPDLPLTANTGKLGETNPLRYGPEGCTGLDWLKLHRISNQNDFRTGILDGF